MEKFGIFELLDTLSALVTSQDGSQNTPEQATPSTGDAAFAPPAYGAPPQEMPKSEANAVTSLLDRHDKISRRIDKKQ